MRTTLACLASLAMIAGCNPDGADLAPDDVVEDGIELLSARRQLIRLSVDLRGAHPSRADLEFIEQHPDAYEQYVDRYLEDPRFVQRMTEIWNRSLRTRTGQTYFDPREAGLGMLSDETVADSIGEEPLKMIAHVIEKDLPFSEVVTADYTLADPIVAAMWDLPYPEGKTGWQQTAYDDGRPMAGLLSSTTLWQRYPSAGVNSNRHRANSVSRIFLCDDYLSRPVSFSRTQIDTLTTGDPEDVIQNTQVCQSCHSTLDPFASHFFGFWWEIEGELDDQTLYRPEDEPAWRTQMGSHVSPAFYGIPTRGMEEMAQHLAEDPRFVECAVRTTFDGITQRDSSDLDRDEMWTHRVAFEDSGLVVRDLVRSIVTSRTYRAQSIIDAELATEGLEERLPVLKTVTPAQFEGIIHSKTGYRWSMNGRPALAKNVQGLAVLSGGTDSLYVNEPNSDPSVGLVFVQERLAQAAGWHVATHDLDPDRDGEAILLKYVTREDSPETNREAFQIQIEQLYLDVLGVPLERPEGAEDAPGEPPEVAELIRMWKQLYSVDADPDKAWAGIVSVVLRDPMLIFY
ncbi:MAG: DUF1549 domain-containing protein [Myxococcota bacterium]